MDFAIFNVLRNFLGQGDFLNIAVIFFAKYLPYFLVIGALFFIFRLKLLKSRIYALSFLALSVILARGIITPLIRFFYDRPRPFEVLSFEPLFQDFNPSFPSGHGAFFFALALAIFSLNRRWGFWFLGLALLNGLSRIIAGIHWPSDILGGIVVAVFSFFAVKKILNPYRF